LSPARPPSKFEVTGTRVRGTARVGDMQPPGAREIQPATLISFATDLVLSGAGKGGPEAARASSILDVKATFLASSECETMEGEAFLLHEAPPVSVWHSRLRAAGGPPLAEVVHTLINRSAAENRPAGTRAPDPPKPRPGLRKVDCRRQDIARAACEVIAEKGFAAATMREIAQAAGMHVPTMYQYVASKEEVLELVYRWVIDRVRVNVDGAFSDASPADERLIGVVRSLIDNNEAMRRESGVLNREMRSLSRRARQRVVDDYAEIVLNVAKIIAEGVERGHFREVNPLLTANFIDALCDIWSLRQFAVGRFGLEAFKSEMERFVQFGLRGDPKEAGKGSGQSD